MKNYAEELAFWYFRFNGFFLLDDYVVHRGIRRYDERLNPHEAGAHSDTDILGLRPNYVIEDVGYPDHKCDFLSAFIPIESKTVGIICEVKAGDFDQPNNHNLDSLINRLGLFKDNREIIEHLLQNPCYYDPENKISIIKILIRRRDDEEASWNIIRIDQIIKFIEDRFVLFEDEKIGGWDKFSSPMIQLMLTYHKNV